MSDEKHNELERSFALAEIEKALLDADTNEMKDLIESMGIEGEIEEDVEAIRRGLTATTGSFGNREVTNFAEAALLSVKNPIAARARLRLVYAISSNPTLGSELSLSMDKVKALSDDSAIALYERLTREGKVT